MKINRNLEDESEKFNADGAEKPNDNNITSTPKA